jgi:hypothetical protein
MEPLGECREFNQSVSVEVQWLQVADIYTLAFDMWTWVRIRLKNVVPQVVSKAGFLETAPVGVVDNVVAGEFRLQDSQCGVECSFDLAKS